MDRAKLKTYAPQARRAFIQAMKARAAHFGITDKGTTPATMQGDLAFIQGIAHPKSTEALRQRLTRRIETEGFEQVMEAMAHTWFNRFAALRYMELHGYLDHGYRVFSHPEGRATPEILEQAEHVDLPALQRERVVDLKLEGKEQELYRLLLVAQCNALHQAMPFLFEAIEDETELLLPDNLLHSDSLISQMISNLDSEDCETVEVLGWLYQFYIAEKKDTVMARKSAVPTDDIPAVTQLFTPHWIVRYLVENTLGRLWLLNRPGSRLREQMPYYIEGLPETDFLKISKPEEIRLIDPAVGSGHMLTYAFDLLFLIYQEEGYAPAEIPGLILRHNLYGLDLCPRAAQLSGVALVFKAREKSRRFFQTEQLVHPNVLELRDLRFADNELGDYIQALELGGLFNQLILKLLHQFEDAKIFGSLILPDLDEQSIAFVRNSIETKGIGGQLFLRETHLKVLRVLEQAEALSQRYHVVVTNPPYMGSGGMNSTLREWVLEHYPNSKLDTMTCFMDRIGALVLHGGFWGLINLPSWLLLGSFSDFRAEFLKRNSIQSLLHLGRGIFGADFGSVAFIAQSISHPAGRLALFRRLFEQHSIVRSPDEIEMHFKDFKRDVFWADQTNFSIIPGTPISYWYSDNLYKAFHLNKLRKYATPMIGIQSGDNNRFYRLWWETSFESIYFGPSSLDEFQNKEAWVPLQRGGEARKWYGNCHYIVNVSFSGRDILACKNASLRNSGKYFKEAVSWNRLSNGRFYVRLVPKGFAFDDGSPFAIVNSPGKTNELLAVLGSSAAQFFVRAFSTGYKTEVGHVNALPIPESVFGCDTENLSIVELVKIARADWDNFETSWDFHDQPMLRPALKGASLEESWRNWAEQCAGAIRRMQELETENNRFFIASYGLEGELEPAVPEEQITLARADVRKDVAAFLSYAVGCMMGRYCLGKPGLIYAHAGNVDFDASQYASFPADEDGIVPVTEFAWFPDDAAIRFEAFVKAQWSSETLEQNLAWCAESLDAKNDETPRETIRRYFATGLYKDHLQTYKKRPIYWLFGSGKERAFQALVYLNRYNEGTLARMRTEYVIPLQGRVSGRIEQLREDIARATSTAHGKKLQKELDTLRKQQVELHEFDEKLRHSADLRISLDLDDGVKVNYAKFGDLLAETKAITGGKDEE